MPDLLGLRLPKEHGAWAMLYVPFALGCSVAGRVSWALLWALVAMTALFFARETLWRLRQARRRQHAEASLWRGLAFEAAVLGLCAALLLFRYRLVGFVPLGIAALLLLAFHLQRSTQREERSVAAELLAIAGFAMAAPAAHYAARAVWQDMALWLWLLSGLYFSSSVFHVKSRVLEAQRLRRRAFLRMRRLAVAYHSGLLVLLCVLVARRLLPALVLLGYAPILLRSAWSIARPAVGLDLRRIGVLEIVYALHFLLFTTLALRSWGSST